MQLLLTAWTLLVLAIWLVGPFVLARTVNWPADLTYLALLAVGFTIHGLFVRRRNPHLAEKRRSIGAGTRPWDVAWVALFWPLMAAAPSAAGLERRLEVAPLPAGPGFAGLVLFAAGLSLSAWAMASNPFFEGTARIQPEQQVVDQGPYRRVRHPGYAGLILWACATPLLLLSRWALCIAAATTAWLILRAVLEDRMLRRDLPGYLAYAERVGRLLMPQLW